MTAFNTSSTSINVTWEPVPDDHVNGIVLGYRLFCKQADKPINDFSNLTVNSTVLSIGLDSLEFYTKYELRLLAFTMVGDGNISEPVYCMTDEDGKFLLHQVHNMEIFTHVHLQICLVLRLPYIKRWQGARCFIVR